MRKQLLMTGISVAIAIVALVAIVYVASSGTVQQPISTRTTNSSSISTTTIKNSSQTSPTSPVGSSSASGSSSTTSVVVQTSSTATWQVISTNVTVYYGTACIPVEFSQLSCPTMNTDTHSPSLTNVELIRYQGTYYYDLNFTYYLNGQPVTHTFWFTNSTVFCISPNDRNYSYPTCPTHPVQPVTIVLGTNKAAASVNSSIGLRLELRLSVDSASKGTLGIVMGESNIFARVNNVTAANSWPIPPDSLKDICVTYMLGYAVYQGNYGLKNFTKGTLLALIEPNVRLYCQQPTPQTYYSFQPLSDNATISPGNSFPSSESTRPILIADSVSGYWTGGVTASNFNSFPVGIYTVVVVDQWGQVAILHFTVKNG